MLYEVITGEMAFQGPENENGILTCAKTVAKLLHKIAKAIKTNFGLILILFYLDGLKFISIIL